MKKILIYIFMMCSLVSLSTNINEYLINQQEYTLKLKRDIESTNTRLQLEMSDFYSADYALKNLSKLNRNYIDETVLILPSVEFLDRYIEDYSKISDDIIIFLFEKKVNKPYLANRSYEDYLEKNLDKKISKLKNVRVFIAENDVILEDTMIAESLIYPVNETEYYKKHIKNIYEKNTKYSYYKIINK